jgi:nucleoside-diphosphate-sugar epimerase
MSTVKKAFVTGGSGYLGSHLCKLLKRNGWKVYIYDSKHPEHKYYDCSFGRYDIRSRSDLRNCVEHIKPDVVFHLAGRIEVGESIKYPTEFYEVNVGGTVNLLNAMHEFGINNIIYSSTAGVYVPQKEKLSESHPVDWQNNPYAGSKLAAEQAIKQSGNSYCIFRYFNLAGADPEGELGENHFPETHLIPKIYENLNNFVINGDTYDTLDGTCIRDFVHVSDVADMHLQMAEKMLNESVANVINLGSGIGYSIKEILNLAGITIGQKIPYTIGPKRDGDPDILVSNIFKAQELFDFKPKHGIMEILKTAYDWHLKK